MFRAVLLVCICFPFLPRLLTWNLFGCEIPGPIFPKGSSAPGDTGRHLGTRVLATLGVIPAPRGWGPGVLLSPAVPRTDPRRIGPDPNGLSWVCPPILPSHRPPLRKCRLTPPSWSCPPLPQLPKALAGFWGLLRLCWARAGPARSGAWCCHAPLAEDCSLR